MRLYEALVLPVLDFGAAVITSSLAECSKEFGKVQRCAMLKASGCRDSTSTDVLEILINTTPVDLYLKLRQAQKMIRNDQYLARQYTSIPKKTYIISAFNVLI